MQKNETNTKKCKSCHLDIPFKASKCTHCSSFQNWRAYLTINQTILALLVAFVSVSTVLFPMLQDWFETDKPEVMIRFLKTSNRHISFAVINEGEQGAFYGDCYIVLYPGNQEYPLDLEFDQKSFIPKQSDDHVRMVLRYPFAIEPEKIDSATIRLEIFDRYEKATYHWYDFADSSKSKQTKYDLFFLEPLLYGQQNRTAIPRPRTILTELYFGMNTPTGTVSAVEWEQFEREVLVPGFTGFTVVNAEGHWEGANDHALQEKSKVVRYIHEEAFAIDRTIDSVIQVYKNKFKQEAVLRTDQLIKMK